MKNLIYMYVKYNINYHLLVNTVINKRFLTILLNPATKLTRGTRNDESQLVDAFQSNVEVQTSSTQHVKGTQTPAFTFHIFFGATCCNWKYKMLTVEIIYLFIKKIKKLKIDI